MSHRGSLTIVRVHNTARTTGQTIGDSFTVEGPAILSGTAVFDGAAKLVLDQTEGAATISGAFKDGADLTADAPLNFQHVLRPGVTYQLKTTGGSITVTVTAQVTFGAPLGS